MENLKRNIAIVCGGDSSEHDVSLRSAQGLYSFFDKERYNIYLVDIKGTNWHVNLDNGNVAPIDRGHFSFMARTARPWCSTTLISPYMASRARTA